MKLKYFLRGLGTGILLTALILCVNNRNSSSGKDVVEQAKELGMVFPKGTEKPVDALLPTSSPQSATPTPKQDKKVVASGAGVTGEGGETEKQGETKKPDGAEKSGAPQSTPTVTPQATKKPAKKSAKPKKVTNGREFTVRGGLLSSSVAREMKEAGIINNADAFDEYLEKSGNAKKVRAGTYKIPKGASYEQIARIITRQD